MARNFYIDNINDNDKLNEISILLNDMEEVSRIKINKNGISFYSEHPENVDELLKERYPDLILKEEINSRKREYVATKKKIEYIFMFTNLESEEDAKEIEEVISHYFKHHTSRSCERTFANVYLWSRQYPVKWAIVEDALVFKSEDENHLAFAYPAGEPENVKKALEVLMEYSKERGVSFQMYNVTPDNFDMLEEWYPGRFQIEYNRDLADYVYEAEKLATLSGKKLHGKRNHINKFKTMYEGRWSYESVTKENLEDCFQMALKWRNQNGCEDDPEKRGEICVTLNALRLFEELELVGGILKVDGEIIAFTLGEPVCSDTFVVHIEKAFAEIQGAYPMINQQFVEHECQEYTYVNREEDTGAEGLRKAKLSYRPVFMVEKGRVTERA